MSWRSRGDVLIPPPAPRPVALAFLDPPYGLGLAGKALEALREAGWIGPDTWAIVEIGRGETLDATGSRWSGGAATAPRNSCS